MSCPPFMKRDAPGWHAGKYLSFVLPVPRASFGDPLHRGLDPAAARLLAFRLGDPLHVLPLVTRWQSSEFLARGRAHGQGRLQIGRNGERRLRLSYPRHLHPGPVQSRSLPHERDENSLGGQILEALDPAELPHGFLRVFSARPPAALQERGLPEPERGVPFEGSLPAERPLVLEGGHAPFDR